VVTAGNVAVFWTTGSNAASVASAITRFEIRLEFKSGSDWISYRSGMTNGSNRSYSFKPSSADTYRAWVRAEGPSGWGPWGTPSPQVVVTDTAPEARAATTKTHVFQTGDTLYGLARDHLGSGERWREIAELNEIPEDQVDEIPNGAVILIPVETSAVSTGSAAEPGAVSKPTLSNATGNLQASWNMPNNNGSAINVYEVSLETSSGRAVSRFTTKSRYYTFRSLSSGPYQVEVRARNDNGWGPWSQVSSVVQYSSGSTSTRATTTTKATAVPGKVSRPSLSNIAGNLQASWNMPDNNGSAINLYQVQLETSSGTYVSAHTTRNKYWTFRSLSDGQRYQVRVVARNNSGWGSWSIASSVVRYSSSSVTTTTKASQYTSSQKTTLLKKYSWQENSTQVKALQRVLQITADGIYGPGTRKAHLAALNGASLSTWGVPQAQSAATTTTSGYTHPSKINKPSAGTPYLIDGKYAVRVSWDPPSQSGSSAVKTYEVECCDSAWIWKFDEPYYSYGNLADVPGGRQSFRVRAINHEGREGSWSPWSSSVWIPTAGATTTTRPPATTTTTTRPPTTTAEGWGWSSGGSWLGCHFDGTPMWGSVYVTDYPSTADYTVYVADYVFSADLAVYVTDYSFSASSCGLWANADYSFSADFSVYFTPYQSGADFTISYVDYSFSAGR
jgi:hypothetical protein